MRNAIDNLVHKIQRLIPLSWVAVHVECSKCKEYFKWHLNDTEVIFSGELIGVCPHCKAMNILQILVRR
jgi:hypothetical protein